MAKSDIIVLLAEGGVLRGVKFSPRGRDSWTRVSGDKWPLEAEAAEAASAAATDGKALEPAPPAGTPAVSPAEAGPAADGADAAGTVVATDTPLARALVAARKKFGGHKVVLALPLAKLFTRILKVPVEMRDDLQSAVSLQISKVSPFPEEELSVGFEVLNETEKELWVFAAAMSESVYQEIADSMRLARLQVVRTDVALLGWYRSLCGPCELTAKTGRSVLLMEPDGVLDAMVLDNGVPVLARGLGVKADDTAGLTRELVLSLMNAELEAGPSPLKEILILSDRGPSPELDKTLTDLFKAPVKHSAPPNEDGGVEGVALRTGEGAVMDLTPQAWRDEIREQTIRKRILTGAGIAAAVWLVAMIAMFAGPAVYNQMTLFTRKQARQHQTAFKRVSDTRERVKLIESYMDRTYSPLEMLRILSGYLPDGVTLTAITYKRTEGVKISGEADDPPLVYQFKNAVTEDPLFASVSLTGPSAVKGRYKFDVNAVFKGSEEKK
jgi:hypothetical protein